jgi:DNA-binding NarL/FixJ family response regulator
MDCGSEWINPIVTIGYDVVTHRILIIDSNVDFRNTLSCYLQSEPDFEIVGETENRDKGLQLARALNPDVILLDIEMPEVDSVADIRRLKHALPDVRIIVLSIVQSSRYRDECLRAGTRICLLKDSPVEAICAAIRSA